MKIEIHNIRNNNGVLAVRFTSEHNESGVEIYMELNSTREQILSAVESYITKNFVTPNIDIIGEHEYIKVEETPTVTPPVEKTPEEILKESEQKILDEKSSVIGKLSEEIKNIVLGLKEDKEIVEIAKLTTNEEKIVDKQQRIDEKFADYAIKYADLKLKKSELKILQEEFDTKYTKTI